MKYILNEKNNKTYLISYMSLDEVLSSFNPFIRNDKIGISNVKIYDRELNKEFFVSVFKRGFNKVENIVMMYLFDEDDTSDGDAQIILDEIAHLKVILEGQFKMYLENMEYQKYIDKLYYFDQQLRQKVAIINQLNSFEKEEELLENRGRGR